MVNKQLLKIIVAMDVNGVIGDSGVHPLKWKLSKDLIRFKELTENNIVIMGYNTFKSIGKPLPNRINIVISRNHQDELREQFADLTMCHTATSLEEAIRILSDFDLISLNQDNTRKVFLIGGATLYNEALEKHLVNEMFITKVYAEIEGDAKIIFNEMEWQKCGERFFNRSEKDEYETLFYKLIPKSK
jgi:dihydrofolate reductase